MKPRVWLLYAPNWVASIRSIKLKTGTTILPLKRLHHKFRIPPICHFQDTWQQTILLIQSHRLLFRSWTLLSVLLRKQLSKTHQSTLRSFRMHSFRELLNDCSLLDVVSKGCAFPAAEVFALPAIGYDHSPLLRSSMLFLLPLQVGVAQNLITPCNRSLPLSSSSKI